METTTSDFEARQPPAIRYRGVAEPTVSSDTEQAVPADRRPAVLQWLNWGIFGVIVAVWAVVGALVWIPLLLRTMVRLALALVPATLQGGHPTAAAEDLRGAVDFYRRGFVVASDAVHGRAPARPSHRPVRTGGLWGEFFWAAGVWYVILALFGVVWSPWEIGRWALARPWSEWAVSALAGILEPFS